MMEGDIVPNFSHSLVGVKPFADAGCISVFHPHQEGVTIHRKEDVRIEFLAPPIVQGVRDESGLWKVPLNNDANANLYYSMASTTTTEKANLVKDKPKPPNGTRWMANTVYELPTIAQGLRWMHAVCGYPVKSTWVKAIKAGNFIGWPLLTVERVNKHYPETNETIKGHANQSRMNTRSTKTKPLPTVDTPALRGKKERDVYIKVYKPKGTTYLDQTGRFPYHSQQGYKYIMVMVEVDSNAILVAPMKNRTDAEMQRVYLQLLSRIKRTGIFPRRHVLDNECSTSMKQLIKEQCQLELVPLHCHRRNVAEVAIKAFKQHFLSVIAGVATDFPMN